jgi:hypothetical protein
MIDKKYNNAGCRKLSSLSFKKIPNLLVFLCAMTLMSACTYYQDDEKLTYYSDAILSILRNDDPVYQPNRVTFLENISPSTYRLLSSNYGGRSLQSQLDDAFIPYVTSYGFSVICTADKERKILYIILNQKGTYITVRTYPIESSMTTMCKSRSGQ